jgi:hypothetical protein
MNGLTVKDGDSDSILALISLLWDRRQAKSSQYDHAHAHAHAIFISTTTKPLPDSATNTDYVTLTLMVHCLKQCVIKIILSLSHEGTSLLDSLKQLTGHTSQILVGHE